MNRFDRTIAPGALDALAGLTFRNIGWWPDLLTRWAPSGNSGQLRVAIRNGYMNFYAKGQSVAKITFGQRRNKPVLHIHEKYVIGPKGKDQKYIQFDIEGNSNLTDKIKYEGLQTLDAWIKKAECYSNDEKRHIDDILKERSTVVDLEMGLPAYEGRKSALRVDIVSVEEVDGEIQVIFSEAKMISDARLRSRNREPEVLNQINKYKAYLANKERRRWISEAYRSTCSIIRNIHSMANEIRATPDLDPLIVAASKPNIRLQVRKELRLIVFDDGKQRREEVWQEHLGVLRREVPVEVLRYGAQGFEVVID